MSFSTLFRYKYIVYEIGYIPDFDETKFIPKIELEPLLIYVNFLVIEWIL